MRAWRAALPAAIGRRRRIGRFLPPRNVRTSEHVWLQRLGRLRRTNACRNHDIQRPHTCVRASNSCSSPNAGVADRNRGSAGPVIIRATRTIDFLGHTIPVYQSSGLRHRHARWCRSFRSAISNLQFVAREASFVNHPTRYVSRFTLHALPMSAITAPAELPAAIRATFQVRERRETPTLFAGRLAQVQRARDPIYLLPAELRKSRSRALDVRHDVRRLQRIQRFQMDHSDILSRSLKARCPQNQATPQTIRPVHRWASGAAAPPGETATSARPPGTCAAHRQP